MEKIEVKNLVFGYEKNQPVINDISFTIHEGEFISIIGHNGSGKSTIAKLLDGLIKPDSGKIIIEGIEISDKSINDIRKKVAIVFQNPDNQFIGATVEDDVAFGLENRNVPREEIIKLVNEYLEKVGMINYKEKEPTYLSGGQKQRVAIAGALVLNPSILILDEATAMLNPTGKKEIHELIKNMRKVNPSLTIISITHDIEETYFSDYIFVMDKGKIILKSTPLDLFKNSEILAKYSLNPPFLFSFVDKLKQQGIDIDYSKSSNEVVEKLCQLK